MSVEKLADFLFFESDAVDLDKFNTKDTVLNLLNILCRTGKNNPNPASLAACGFFLLLKM